MKIECEVNLGCCDGDEYVAIKYIDSHDSSDTRVVRRAKWTQPSWMRPGWLWMDDRKQWRWHSEMPSVESGEWRRQGAYILSESGPYELTPPVCFSHACSLRKIHGLAPIPDPIKTEVSDLAEVMLSRANLRYKVITCIANAGYRILDQENNAITMISTKEACDADAKKLNSGDFDRDAISWFPVKQAPPEPSVDNKPRYRPTSYARDHGFRIVDDFAGEATRKIFEKDDAWYAAIRLNNGTKAREAYAWYSHAKIPDGVSYDNHRATFVDSSTGLNKDTFFYNTWMPRKNEFPVWAEGAATH